MILSVAHKFVFIKGLKVAGTSIEIALAAICGPDDIVAPILPVDERQRLRDGTACRNYSRNINFEKAYLKLLAEAAPENLALLQPPPQIFYNHMSLREIIQRYPGSLGGFRIVCAERSPYAKVISWLNMQEAMASYRTGGEMRSDPSRLHEAFDRVHAEGRIHMVRNIDRYRDADDALGAQVFRYETLQEDFNSFVARLGFGPVVLPHAKKGLMSDTLDPREVFRRDQLDTINLVFVEEFDAFGYGRV